jgi:hypothetical protein
VIEHPKVIASSSDAKMAINDKHVKDSQQLHQQICLLLACQQFDSHQHQQQAVSRVISKKMLHAWPMFWLPWLAKEFASFTSHNESKETQEQE